MEQGLIQWSHTPPELATWEPLVTLRQQSPRAPAWGHAGSEDPGTASSSGLAAPEEEDATPSLPTGPLPIRPKRVTKPSSRVTGPSRIN